MRAAKFVAILALACFAAWSVEVASASDLPAVAAPEDALLYQGDNGRLASADKQRSLLATGYYAPSYPPPCPNANIKTTFTAKVAVLLVGTKRYGRTINSGHYVKLIKKRLSKRFKRYNKRYSLSLGYAIRQLTTAELRRGVQKWFYYEIQLNVGDCGLYKRPLISQIRGDLQPSARYIKRIRIQSYPYKK